jgi:hypothetical protein
MAFNPDDYISQKQGVQQDIPVMEQPVQEATGFNPDAYLSSVHGAPQIESPVIPNSTIMTNTGEPAQYQPEIPQEVPDIDVNAQIKQLRKLNKDEEGLLNRKSTYKHTSGFLSTPNQTGNTGQDIQSNLLTVKQKKDEINKQLALTGITPEQAKVLVELDTLKDPKLIESLRQESGRYVGAMAGAYAGGEVGSLAGPYGVVPGAVIGAGLGAITGKSAQQYATEGKVNLPEVGQAAKEEMLWEFGGRVVPMVFKGTAKLGLNKFTNPIRGKEKQESIKMAEELRKYGGVATPASTRDSVFFDLIENAAYGSAGGGEVMNKIEQTNKDALVKMYYNMASDMAQTPIPTGSVEEIKKVVTGDYAGNKFLQNWSKGNEVFTDSQRGIKESQIDDLFSSLYGKLDEMTGLEEKVVKKPFIEESKILDSSGKTLKIETLKDVTETTSKVTFNASNMIQKAKELLKQHSYAVKKGGEGLLSGRALEITQNVAKWDKDMPMKLLREYRSSWLREVENLKTTLDPSEMVVSKYAQMAKDTLFDDTLAKGLTPEARSLLKNTNALYTRAKEITENFFTKKAMEELGKSPSSVVKSFLPDGNQTEFVKRTRDNLLYDIYGKETPVGKEAWNALKSAKLVEGLNHATEGFEAGKMRFNLPKFENWIKSFGENSAYEVFGKDTINRIRKYAKYNDALFPMEQKGTENTLSASMRYRGLGIQIKGIGLAIGGGALIYGSDDPQKKMLGTAAIGIGGALTLSPVVYARMLQSDEGYNLLTKGFDMTPKSKGYIPFVHRVVKLLENEDSIADKEQQKIDRAAALQKQLDNSRQNIFGKPLGL